MNKVFLRYRDGGERLLELNEDISDDDLIVVGGTLFSYVKMSSGIGHLPVYEETTPPRIVTVKT